MGGRAYTIERGEVLMSLQRVLLRERWAPPERRPAPAPRTFGAGTPRSLDRDESAERPVRRRVSLIAFSLRFRADADETAREAAMAMIVGAAQQVLRGDDRAYRTGPTELTFRLYDTDEPGAEVAMIRVEARARRRLAEDGLPAPAFDSLSVDPGVVIRPAASA